MGGNCRFCPQKDKYWILFAFQKLFVFKILFLSGFVFNCISLASIQITHFYITTNKLNYGVFDEGVFFMNYAS